MKEGLLMKERLLIGRWVVVAGRVVVRGRVVIEGRWWIMWSIKQCCQHAVNLDGVRSVSTRVQEKLTSRSQLNVQDRK
jgi:hypothetical protein